MTEYTNDHEKLQLITELNTINSLMNVDGLTIAGLHEVRRRLRLHDTAAAVAVHGENVVMIRAQLLDRVSRAIVSDGAGLLDVYRGMGDALIDDEAPDDISELEE